MKRKRELGYCQVTIARGGSWHLARSQFDPVRKAWMAGRSFVETVGFHGDRVTIKLADVDSVCDIPAETEQSALHERRADEADDSLAGGTA